MKSLHKIALGGGCHWCTEAVFQSLRGVSKVEQGFVASQGQNSTFSEAVILHYDSNEIQLKHLIHIHLCTHESTSEHSMRNKYRSAVYVFNEEDKVVSVKILMELQTEFENSLITEVLTFNAFKPSDKMFHDYYYSDKNKPFCKTFINPKLNLLLAKFSEHVDPKKLTL